MSANNFSLRSNIKMLWIKRIIAILVLVGFTWLIVVAVSKTTSDEYLEPELVKAPTMVKQRPDAPGGMAIEHQDKKLFDLLESEESSNEVSDSVMKKAQIAKSKDAELSQQAIEKKKLEQKAEEKAQEAIKTVATIKKEAKQAAKTTTATIKKAAVETKETVKEAKEAVQKTIATKAPETAVTGWAVQLGSFRSQEDAKRAVGIYNNKVGNILTGLNSYVKRVDLGTKGVVYRVYFTGLNDGEHAKQICAQLKVQKQGCLRAKL